MLSRVLCNFYRLPCLHGTVMCLVSCQYILPCFPIALQPFTAPQLSILGSREPNCAVFSAKSDRITSISQRPDGLRRYKRGIMKFNTLREGSFLRLPKSYRVAEKSDPIGSREPNRAVFQQITTVVHAQLNAPMDPSVINSQA